MDTIRQNFCDIFKKTRQVLLSDELSYIDKHVLELTELGDSMREWLTLIDNLTIECKTKSFELQDEINFNAENHDNSIEKSNLKFISHEQTDRMLSWVEINDIEENKEKRINLCDNIIEKLSNNPLENMKEITIINNINIGSIKVPIVQKLDQIPPSINWFIGDSMHKPGFYMSLDPGYYIEIPFPDTIDGTKNSNRNSSIKCKYGSLENCHNMRETLANKYKSEVRKCNFAHTGDRYIKIGTSFRCPSAPSFGNYYDLKTDMQKIDINDVKMLLMYATSDLLLSNIWLQKYHLNEKPMVLNSLDICD
jgi:hypothetical protein